MVYRYSAVREMLVWGLGVAVILGLAGACRNPDDYKRSADKEVYEVLTDKWQEDFGRQVNYEVSEETPNDVDIARMIPLAGVINLAQAVNIATQFNREYQSQKEALYIAALDLTGTRHQYKMQWFGTFDATYATNNGTEDSTVGSEARVNQNHLLGDGIQIGTGLAIDWVRYLSGDPHTTLGSVLTASVSAPLLGAGVGKAARENLTQAERNVLYQIRTFNRYRKTFVISIVDAYYRVLQRKDTVRVTEDSYKRQIDNTNRLIMEADVGKRPQADAAEARQDLLTTENALVSARQEYEQALDNFKIELSLPADANVVLDQSELLALEAAGVYEPTYSEAEAIEIALSRRLDLATTRDRLDDVERKLILAAEGLGVQLNLVGSANVDSTPDTDYTRLRFHEGSYSLGLEGDLPFDRKIERNAYREAYDIQVIQNESSIANDLLSVRFALLDLQKYLGAELANELVKDVNAIVSLTDHVTPVIEQAKADPNILAGSGAAQTLKSLQDSIVVAQGTLKNAQATLIGTVQLHDANYVSDLDLEEDKLMVVNRQFTEEGAHVNLDLFREYDFPKTAEQLLSVYIEAGRELQRTYAQCRSQLAQRQATLSNAELTYQHQDERVKKFIAQVDSCTIRAKAPGLVIYGEGDSADASKAVRGKGIIAEGENVWEGLTIISMPDTAEMVAEIGVHETEVDKVRPGQRAEIVMDAFPDRVLQGEVLEVAPLPDQERSLLNPDLKLYKTLVKINGTHDYLKTRMSCRVQILIQRLEDVVIVPIHVVANRGGRRICYVKAPQGLKEREVRTGAFNDAFTEIVEGLQPGEKVLLNPPVFTEGVTDTAQADQQRFGGRNTPEPDRAGAQAPGETEATRDRKEPASPEKSPKPRDPRSLSDERMDEIITAIGRSDPSKGEELQRLRRSDPDEFRARLTDYLLNKRTQAQDRPRGASPDASGGSPSDARPGRSRPTEN